MEWMRRGKRPGKSSRLRGRSATLFRPEGLEPRTLLTTLHNLYAITDLPLRNVEHTSPAVKFNPRIGPTPRELASLDNDGRIINGVDREGDEYTITVHGPGSIIVTDVSPFDAILDDDIDTIQLVGTDVNNTYITAQTTGSALNPTDGIVRFNRIIGETGAASIVLNGFSLARTRTPGAELNADPEIFLPAGVKHLEFHNIEAYVNTAADTGYELISKPFQIVIGDPTTPLTFKPSIKLDHIFNTVYNTTYNDTRISKVDGQTYVAPIDPTLVNIQTLNILTPPTAPLIDPTVEIIVNGELESLDVISITGAETASSINNPILVNNNRSLLTESPIRGAGKTVQFPIVGSTGRTAVRATGAGQLKVNGNIKNTVLSRSNAPFANGFTGLDRLGNVTVGGNADGLGLDVNGPIGNMTFAKGLGSPVDNRLNSPISTSRAATNLGIPDASRGYPTATGLLAFPDTFTKDPATGGYGALINATTIDTLKVGNAETKGLLGQNPRTIQRYGQGRTAYVPRAGNALTSAAVTAQSSIGSVEIVGDASNSEIQAGFDYQSFVNGVDPVRSGSSIANLHQPQGDMVDTVIGSSYDTGPDNNFNTADDTIGPGSINGRTRGRAIQYGNPGASVPTVLGRDGTGAFAAVKTANLPLPNPPTRVRGNLVR